MDSITYCTLYQQCKLTYKNCVIITGTNTTGTVLSLSVQIVVRTKHFVAGANLSNREYPGSREATAQREISLDRPCGMMSDRLLTAGLE